MKTVLVTGGAGFIGSNLVDELILNNYKVIVIDNQSSDSHNNFYWNNDAINHIIDVCDYKSCFDIFKLYKPETVFHLAAESKIQNCIDNPIKAHNTNTIGTLNMLELSKQFGVHRFIYSSTSAIYGNNTNGPIDENVEEDCLNHYSSSKLNGEKLCKLYWKLYNLETIIFRYFNVYGKRQPTSGQYAPVFGIFKKQKENKQKLTVVGDGEQRRDFVNVSDVVNANVLAATKIFDKWQIKGTMYKIQQFGEVYNIGSGKNYSINEIVNIIGGEKIYIPPRIGEVKNSLANIDKSIKTFQWKPKINVKDWLESNIKEK